MFARPAMTETPVSQIHDLWILLPTTSTYSRILQREAAEVIWDPSRWAITISMGVPGLRERKLTLAVIKRWLRSETEEGKYNGMESGQLTLFFSSSLFSRYPSSSRSLPST